MTFDLVIKDGKIVDPLDGISEEEIGIRNGRIEAIGTGLAGKEEIIVPGCFVFPGFVDTHVHYRWPGATHKEDYRTGTMASAHGGCTTVFDMPNTNPAGVTAERIIQKKEEARRGAIDVFFYGGIDPEYLDEIERMASHVIGYKIFLSETTGIGAIDMDTLEIALNRIRNTGKVVTFHCEDDDINATAATMYDIAGPHYHCLSRPHESEIVAIALALSLGESSGVPIHIAHVSTGYGLGLIKRRRERGVDVTCEATPHHLLFNMNHANSYLKMNPPLRKEEERLALWRGIEDETITCIATDHAPHTREEKASASPPSGVTGADDYARFASLLTKYGPERAVELTSWNAIQRFGLDALYTAGNFGSSGRIMPGYRANLVVMEMKPQMGGIDLQTKCGWSPYEGMEFPGGALYTIHNGRIIMQKGIIV
jgi:dihydroorotase